MQIGTIAKKIGLTADAIRFYERSSLLPSPPRSAGGFRQYGEGDVETLGFIRRVVGLGFTLREIKELLGLRHTRLQPCARRSAAAWTKSFLRSGGSSTIFTSWSTSFGRLWAIAKKNSINDRPAAHFCASQTDLNRRVRIEGRSSLRAGVSASSSDTHET